jgi:hypothetical protein
VSSHMFACSGCVTTAPAVSAIARLMSATTVMIVMPVVMAKASARIRAIFFMTHSTIRLVRMPGLAKAIRDGDHELEVFRITGGVANGHAPKSNYFDTHCVARRCRSRQSKRRAFNRPMLWEAALRHYDRAAHAVAIIPASGTITVARCQATRPALALVGFVVTDRRDLAAGQWSSLVKKPSRRPTTRATKGMRQR